LESFDLYQKALKRSIRKHPARKWTRNDIRDYPPGQGGLVETDSDRGLRVCVMISYI
jgi:hypothetical protein